jgi:hypothetical protein
LFYGSAGVAGFVDPSIPSLRGNFHAIVALPDGRAYLAGEMLSDVVPAVRETRQGQDRREGNQPLRR